MITLITSGPNYKISVGDIDELSRAQREMPITTVVTIGHSPSFQTWAKQRRIRYRSVRNAVEAISISEAAIIFPGHYMEALVQTAQKSGLEVWDWQGSTKAAKDLILASEAVAAHYDAIVNGDIEPEGYGQDMRGRTQDAA